MRIFAALAVLSVATGAMLGFAEPASASTKLILNGDFESVGAGNTALNWTVSPSTEILDLKGSDYIPCCGVFGSAAAMDNHFASFGPGNINNTSTLSQDFATIAGQVYSVSFDAGALGAGSQELVAAIIGGDSLFLSTTANNNLDTTLSTYTFNFTATGALTTLAFNAIGQGDNIDPILDNVSVAAVPEPATWAFFIMGFGLVGFSLRRNRAALFA